MKNEIKSLKNTIKNTNDFYLMDADLLPLMKKAESGCIDSQEKLFFAFWGNGEEPKAKKNYEMAKYYLKMSYEGLSDSKDLGHNIARYCILWDKVLLEGQFKGKEAMTNAFYEMIDYMREHIPLEEWDYSNFRFFERLINAEEQVLFIFNSKIYQQSKDSGLEIINPWKLR